MAVAPINEVRKVLNYAVTAIPRRKILMGVPNYGYNWTLPYVQGSRAVTISNVGAVDLARREGAEIQYDQSSRLHSSIITMTAGNSMWYGLMMPEA